MFSNNFYKKLKFSDSIINCLWWGWYCGNCINNSENCSRLPIQSMESKNGIKKRTMFQVWKHILKSKNEFPYLMEFIFLGKKNKTGFSIIRSKNITPMCVILITLKGAINRAITNPNSIRNIIVNIDPKLILYPLHILHLQHISLLIITRLNPNFTSPFIRKNKF